MQKYVSTNYTYKGFTFTYIGIEHCSNCSVKQYVAVTIPYIDWNVEEMCPKI